VKKQSESDNINTDIETRKRKCDNIIKLYKSLLENNDIIALRNSRTNPEVYKISFE